MVPLALGTQTGGSTIRPAAFCGVVGCKPSFQLHQPRRTEVRGRVPRHHRHAARTVEDAALGLQILSGRAAPDFSRPPVGPPRIGICRTPCWQDADGPTHAAIERVASLFATAGARVDDFELPEGSARLFDEHGRIMGYESARALAWEYLNHPDQISVSLRPRLEEGWQVPRQAYDDARALARDCRRKFADRMQDFDFLLTPSAPGEAPDTLDTTGSSDIQPRVDLARRAMRDLALRRGTARIAARGAARRTLWMPTPSCWRWRTGANRESVVCDEGGAVPAGIHHTWVGALRSAHATTEAISC